MKQRSALANFDQLFKQISPEEIPDDVFTLSGKVFPVISADKTDYYKCTETSMNTANTYPVILPTFG